MSARVYLVTGVFVAGVLIGIILLAMFCKRRTASKAQLGGIWILVAVSFATIFNYVFYNLTFVQLQGRYLFTALIPLGVLAAAGLHGWSLLIGRWLRGERWQQILGWLPLAGIVWMPMLAVYALFKDIVPNLG